MSVEPEVMDEMQKMIKESPTNQKVPLIAIKKLLDQAKDLDKQKEKEISEIHFKYRKLQDPLITRTSQIVKGAALNDSELKNGAKYFNTAETGLLDQHKKGFKIKEYWPTVLENSKFENLISEEDRESLNAIQEIRAQVTKDSIKVWFQFSDNPNFAACTLMRELTLKDGQGVETKGDLITWKPGKCLTHQQVKGRKGDKKQSTQPRQSIFHFFSNHKSDATDDGFSVQEMIFNEIAQEIVPYSLEYYMGVVDNEDDEEEEFEDGDDDDEEDGYDDDDDDDEDRPRKQQKKK